MGYMEGFGLDSLAQTTLFRARVLWTWLFGMEILKSHGCCHAMALSLFLLYYTVQYLSSRYSVLPLHS